MVCGEYSTVVVVTLIVTSLITALQAFLVNESCNTNCTQSPELQCSFQNKEYCGPVEKVPPTWPSPPQDFKYTKIYKREGDTNRCVATPDITWLHPEMPYNLLGFELKIFQLYPAPYDVLTPEVAQLCVVYNVNVISTPQEPVLHYFNKDTYTYHYDCLVLLPGKYELHLYSLPKPPVVYEDPILILNLTVPKVYYRGGYCQEETPTTSPRVTPPTTTTAGGGTVAKSRIEPPKRSSRVWWAIGVGSVAGIVLASVFIALLVRRYRKPSDPEVPAPCSVPVEHVERPTDCNRCHVCAGPHPTVECGAIGGHEYQLNNGPWKQPMDYERDSVISEELKEKCGGVRNVHECIEVINEGFNHCDNHDRKHIIKNGTWSCSSGDDC